MCFVVGGNEKKELHAGNGPAFPPHGQRRPCCLRYARCGTSLTLPHEPIFFPSPAKGKVRPLPTAQTYIRRTLGCDVATTQISKVGFAAASATIHYRVLILASSLSLASSRIGGNDGGKSGGAAIRVR